MSRRISSQEISAYLSGMNAGTLLKDPILRNVLGFLLLAAVHFAPDWYVIPQRSGIHKVSPYLFLLLFYGWIVFHNRILFERLFLQGKKLSYALWTLLFMSVSTLNMYLILDRTYHIRNTLPHILSFWVYTITGLGVYVIFRYLHIIEIKPSITQPPASTTGAQAGPSHFICTVDGIRHSIPCPEILFIESLENYIKVNTTRKKFLVRLTLKEAEERLPKSFIRISRSHILNRTHITGQVGDRVQIQDVHFKIGKVYKRHVEEQLKS